MKKMVILILILKAIIAARVMNTNAIIVAMLINWTEQMHMLILLSRTYTQLVPWHTVCHQSKLPEQLKLTHTTYT